MRVRTLETIKTRKGAIPAGQIIDVSLDVLVKLEGKIELVQADQSCYCETTGCWCSGRLPPGKQTACHHCEPRIKAA